MAAYWISPSNQIIDVPTNHIDIVIKNPETFGLTLADIQSVYESHGEEIGTEGKAREEIILDLVKKGWIRIRQYRNQGWSINVNRLTKKIKDNLFDWVTKVTGDGIFGYRERDLYAPVNILTVFDDVMKKYTTKEILSSALYESNQRFDTDNKLIHMVLKENKMKNWLDFIME